MRFFRKEREDVRLIRTSGLFDEAWYLAQNPDVANAGVVPITHFIDFGWKEGRSPGPAFNSDAYLKANPDVAKAGINPLIHYLEFGRNEGRRIAEAKDRIAQRERFSTTLISHLSDLIERRATTDDPLQRSTLVFYTPRWRGVASSTLNLFSMCLPLPFTAETHPDELSDEETQLVSNAIMESPFRSIVISGGDIAFIRILKAVKRKRPDIQFRLLWHSSYLQMGERHDWNLLMPWLAAARVGQLAKIGVVKPGLEKFLSSQGVEACFVQNVVRGEPSIPEPRAMKGTVGLWHSGSSDYRKPLLPSLVALAGAKDLRLKAAGIGGLGMRVVRDLRLNTEMISMTPISHDAVLSHMRESDITLYVTLSECMPMVPLESIAQGTPCVVGPSTNMFNDYDLLEKVLVVKDPVNPKSIRNSMDKCLADWTSIQSHCRSYLRDAEIKSRSAVQDFLS